MTKRFHTLMAVALVGGALFTLAAPSFADVIITIAPPAVRTEVVPAPPGPPAAWVWRPGHWQWNGAAYVWASGSYIQRERPGAEWVAGHWDHVGSNYVWVEGHWQ
jgi:hypothetical protein